MGTYVRFAVRRRWHHPVMELDLLKRYLEAGLSLEQIGALVDRSPSTVGYWVQKHRLSANGRDKYAARGALTAEQLQPLVDEGLTLTQMAERLNRSITTIRYWLAKLGISRGDVAYRKRQRRLQEAEATGIRKRLGECQRHGQTTFRLDSRGGWYCPQCTSEAVSKRRRRVKEVLVAEAGGQCVICGYDRYVGALQFHHRNPRHKAFHLAQNGMTRSLERAREEVRKCVLLCANCHAEVEAREVVLPAVL